MQRWLITVLSGTATSGAALEKIDDCRLEPACVEAEVTRSLATPTVVGRSGQHHIGEGGVLDPVLMRVLDSVAFA